MGFTIELLSWLVLAAIAIPVGITLSDKWDEFLLVGLVYVAGAGVLFGTVIVAFATYAGDFTLAALGCAAWVAAGLAAHTLQKVW